MDPVMVDFVIAGVAREGDRLMDQWGDRLGDAAAKAVGSLLRKIRDLVTGKLHGDPALALLASEAQAGEVSVRTRQRVELSLAEASDKDKAFASELESLVDELEKLGVGATINVHGDKNQVIQENHGTVIGPGATFNIGDRPSTGN